MRKMIDSCVRFAQPDAYPAAGVPGSSEVWIQSKRPINEGGGSVQVTDHERERVAASREGNRVVPPCVSRPPRQSFSFGDFSDAIGHPAIDLAPCVTPGSHAIG